MRVLAHMVVAMLALSARAFADCPYAVVEIEVAPTVSVDEDGAHVLRWKGNPLSMIQSQCWIWMCR